MSKKTKDDIKEIEGDEVKNEPSSSKGDKIFILRHRNNCSHELHLSGKVVLVFSPNEIKEVPESIINHKDFTKEESKNYVIREKK